MTTVFDLESLFGFLFGLIGMVTEAMSSLLADPIASLARNILGKLLDAIA